MLTQSPTARTNTKYSTRTAMSMESSVFWGNTSHWGVTDAGVLLVVSMASGAGGHFFVLMHISVKK